MNRFEHLMTILGEEGAEVAQRASKCNRFGVEDVEPGQDLANAIRLEGEVIDLIALVQMIQKDRPGMFKNVHPMESERTQAKIDKVEKYLLLSAELGTLTP